MRNELMTKIWLVIILLVIFIIVVFGEDIMAAITEMMTEQTGSMMDRLLG